MTPADLGLILLIAMGVGAVWDLLEPDAVKVQFNNLGRALFTLLFGGADIALLLWVVGASAAVCVAVVAAIIMLTLVKLLAQAD